VDTLTTAIDLFREGKAREAERACEGHLATAPDDAQALSLLAEIQLATGHTARAVALLEQLTQLHPRDAGGQRRIAAALLGQGRAAEAAGRLRQAIDIEPGNARAHNNLGQALMQLRQLPEAIASFEAAVRLDAGYAIGHNNLGLALTATAALDRAVQCFERALALNARLVEAWTGRGAAHALQQRFERALECFDAALSLRPGDPASLRHRAAVLLSLERAAEALDCANAALRVEQHSAETHNIRAGALRRLARHAEALQALEQALAVDPLHVEAWCNRGMVLHEMGDFEAAVECDRKALQLQPDDILVRTRLLARLIPSVPLTEEEVADARGCFESQLLQLESWLNGRVLDSQNALTAAQQQFFYLSYQEESNRTLLERYRSACAARLAKCFAFSAPAGGLVAAPSRRSAQRFKVGFVSAHIHDHSVFNAILQGWLQCLDRTRFDLSLFSVGPKQDALTRAAAASVDRFVSGTFAVSEWVRTIGDCRLDALIFPEIGMNSPTLSLASLRLAPRQFAAWGHPETSGLPTIDGYLSAELFEPADAQEHYTERLVALPNLGVHCRPYRIESAPLDLQRLGITGRGPVFICPGVPFKYRPQDDRILVEIARRLGRCTFVFFQPEVAELGRKLQRRIGAAFREAKLDPEQHLLSIPWQPRVSFFGLLRQADVYLDTIGFSGFNTLMQAIECHLPCVSYDGRFLRGRLGSGILKRLGMTELVATSKEHYIDLAVRLAADPRYRAEIRERIRRSETMVYEDTGTVDALADLLQSSEF